MGRVCLPGSPSSADAAPGQPACRRAGIFLLATAALQVVAVFTPELKSNIVSVAMFLVEGASLSFWTDYQRSTALALFLVGANALGAGLSAVRGAWDPVIFASLSTPGSL